MSERSVLVRLAEKNGKQVVADDAGNITKKQYVDRLVQSGKTPEAIAKDYPNLSKINDDDLIVKNGKYQPKITHRDLPETMTKREFIEAYKAKTNIDLSDPAEMAKSPWRRAIGAASDDALVMKDGEWQVSRLRKLALPNEAKKLVNEQTIDIGKAKDIGLTDAKGKFLMADAKANLNAGQLLKIMQDAKLDPSKLEVLSKMNPDAPIVVDGKLVKAPVAEMSPTSKTFTLRGKPNLSLGLNEGQRAVLAGESMDGEVKTGFNWDRNQKMPAFTYPAQLAFRGAKTVGSTLIPDFKAIALTARDTRLGLAGLGVVDPLAGDFARQGARYGIQNWAWGTIGTVGAYTGYQGLNALAGNNFDDQGNKVAPGEDFTNRMVGFAGNPADIEKSVTDEYQKEVNAMSPAERNALTDKEIQQTLKDRIEVAKAKRAVWDNIWMAQMYNSYQTVGATPYSGILFSAGIPALKGLAGAYMEHKAGTEATAVQNLDAAKKLNARPLVDNPSLLDQPAAAPAVAPSDAPAAPATAPADATPANGDDLAPPPPPPQAPLKQSSYTQPATRPAAAPTGDYLDQQL